MNTRASLWLLAALAVPLTACGGSDTTNAPIADTGVVADTGTPDVAADAAPLRTMVQNPLFGDTHPQNLILDLNFGTRASGVGMWLSESADSAQQYKTTFASVLMSDAPDGLAANVAQLADGSGSKSHFELSLFAQVPGGPGPFEVRVWISTQDPAASAKFVGAEVAVLTAQSGGTTISIHEDTTKARVIAGRTWHLYAGTVNQDLPLAAFLLLDFAGSANTWLLQAPEFVPGALVATGATTKARPLRPATTMRPETTRERELVRDYQRQPHLSVPAWHPSITGRVPGERLP